MWQNDQGFHCRQQTKFMLQKYKVVRIWQGLFVFKQVTVCPGHIWTTLYITQRSLESYSDAILYLTADTKKTGKMADKKTNYMDESPTDADSISAD
jgi:hypothetical protein